MTSLMQFFSGESYSMFSGPFNWSLKANHQGFHLYILRLDEESHDKVIRKKWFCQDSS